MNLGVILSSGDSFRAMSRSGQDIRFKKNFLREYSKNFNKVYIFSYEDEVVSNLPPNTELIPNRYKLHRFLYGILMPILNINHFKDIQVIRTYHLMGTIPAIISRILFSIPFIFNYGYDYAKFALVEKKYIQFLIIKITSPIANYFADRIIVLTKKTYDWKPKSKTVYITNGVDTQLFKPKSNSDTKKLKILNVGRLEEQKNQINIIKALAHSDYNLTIVGDGPLKPKLESLAKRCKTNLKIIKKVDNNKMPQIYKNADLFVLPSIVEGAPKALLEAMSCALVPVVTRIDIVDSIIKDGINGIFCNADSDSIRQSINKISKNKKLRQNISNNARKTIVVDFELKTLIKKEIILLKSLSR